MRPEESARELLERIAAQCGSAALASSLSAEDMVLTDLIARHRLGIDIFTLDTGRLHADTVGLIAEVQRRYGLVIQVVYPDVTKTTEYVQQHGRDAFYDSVELRRRCCHIRKVEPLGRALAGRGAWITGQRRGQTAARGELRHEEFDVAHGMMKFNPLADWSEKEVWRYVHEHGVPYNPLYDQGYRSIGCAPCTRPVEEGEDPRAGRWWWEKEGHGECGIHFSPDGKLIREKAAL